MRLSFLFIFTFLSLNIFAQSQLDTSLTKINGNSFYSITEGKNTKVIVFLHGGVNNPYFDQADRIPSLDYLLESNQSFLKQASQNGFNVLVPITNDSLNWLDNPNKAFLELKKIIEQSNTEYGEVYIAGFSDGGTGSFKIFYNNPNFFDGLIVFNGFPQHNNFSNGVDYGTFQNKKILFFSTYKDKVIPYEFLITEYCSQKKTNPNTFLYLSTGDHSFENYDPNDIGKVFDILTGKNHNMKTDPIQGFIENDKLIVLYPFRKKIVKRYNFGKEVYKGNLVQRQ